MRLKQQGFTLIELMVVLAIVAILARYAFLNYSQQTIKGNRAAAQAALIDMAQREQQCLLDTRGYAWDSITLTAASPTTTATTPNCPYSVPSDVTQYYQVAIVAPATATPPTFKITATPLTGTTQASDSPLTIDQSGNKTPTNLW